MSEVTIVHAAGARPNFVKLAPVVEALRGTGGIRQLLVHTGQHYDYALSEAMLADLGLPQPAHHLGIGSGTHAEQVGRMMIAFERVLADERPDLVVVGGDVNSTVACALAAVKSDVPVAHVEAGLRSFDWTMPEEINRVLTDRVSSFLFTHSPEAEDNLRLEGISEGVHYVGNTMIDSLRRLEAIALERRLWERYGADPESYVLVTLHRPSNVDDRARLVGIVEALAELGRRATVLFPLHPRTRLRLEHDAPLVARLEGIVALDPLPYLDFLSLELGAGAVLTDSGGLQEETSALGIACYTLRPNTERPITIELGTNTLLGEDPSAIEKVRPQPRRPPAEIPLWDGRAGERAAKVLAEALLGSPA